MENYNHSIRKVLKQVHPGSGINSEALNVLNMIVNDLLRDLTKTAQALMKPVNYKSPGKNVKETKTLSVDALKVSLRLILTSELQKHALSEGLKAERKYKDYEKEKQKKKTKEDKKTDPVSSSDKANLQLSVSKTRNAIRGMLLKSQSLEEVAPVFATAVLEYIVAEIIELSGNVCKDMKAKRISVVHIKLAIFNDPELDTLMSRLKISIPGEKAVLKKVKFSKPIL